MSGNSLTSRQRQAIKIQEAHGKVHVLCIGISEYQSDTCYPNLKQCDQDAKVLSQTFKEVHQLNADLSKVVCLCSKDAKGPSRGRIIGAIKDLANGANEEDRIFLFFSGHGDKLEVDGEERLFLVPDDAHESEADALIDFDDIKDILNRSAAKIKVIFLDACFSGPDLSKFKSKTKSISRAFLEKHLADTKGVATISSSEGDQPSTTQSPNPELSLFTFFLNKGLRGDPDAIDPQQMITVDSLFDYIHRNVVRTSRDYQSLQTPVKYSASNGFIMLADFAVNVAPPDSIDLFGSSAKLISFVERQYTKLKKITDYKFQSFSRASFVEGKANPRLIDSWENELGEIAAEISKTMGFPIGDVTPDNGRIEFPDGEYFLKYKADEDNVLSSGSIVQTIELKGAWLERPDRIVALVHAANMTPSEMKISVSKINNIAGFHAGLLSKGWTITKNLGHTVEYSNGSYNLKIDSNSITFGGLAPSDIFGNNTKHEAIQLAGSVFQLLGVVK